MLETLVRHVGSRFGSSTRMGGSAEQTLRRGLRQLSYCLLIALGLGLWCACHQWRFRAHLAFLWALAFYGSGFLIGFLFGIPRVLQNGDAAPQEAGSSRPSLGINTNLEQVSDWLVKILVGLGLTELKEIPGHIYRAAQYIAPGLHATGSAPPPANAIHAAGALVVYFSVLGFLTGYLITRLLLGNLFRGADSRTISVSEEAVMRAGVRPERGRMTLEPKAAEVAAKIESLSLDSARQQGIAPEAIALAKLNAGRVTEAIEAYMEAIRQSADDPQLRMSYAFALRRANLPYADSVKQLEIARSMVQQASGQANAADLKRDIYRSLTYFTLYLDPPASVDQTIFYAKEYLSDPANRPSADITLNLACAYGQAAANISDRDDAAFRQAREHALEALRLAVAIKSDAKARIRELLHAAPGDQDSDLSVFAGDEDFEALVA